MQGIIYKTVQEIKWFSIHVLKKVIKAVLCSKHVFNPFTHNKRKYLNCQTICFATKLKCQHDSVTKQQQGMQTIYKV